MNTILIGPDSNIADFFQRFGATHDDKLTYEPLILSLNYSNTGEYAQSWGLFLNNRNGCLYEVYGDECSVWDFNGQFTPELTSVSYLKEKSQQQHGSDFSIALNHFLDNIDSLGIEEFHGLNYEYMDYMNAYDFSDILLNNEYFKNIQMTQALMQDIFKDNLIEVEHNLSFFKFSPKYDNLNQTFYMSFQRTPKLLAKNDFDYFLLETFVPRFINDFIGSIEIKENIFNDNNNNNNFQLANKIKKPKI